MGKVLFVIPLVVNLKELLDLLGKGISQRQFEIGTYHMAGR